MRIGLISDTHNEQDSIARVLDRLRVAQVHVLLHAGDITSTRTLRMFSGFNTWLAQGNMDRDPALPSIANELFGAGRFDKMHDLELDSVHIAVIHGDMPESFRRIVYSNQYTYVIYGHTHRHKDEMLGHTRVINPGALGSPRWKNPTFAILDHVTGDLIYYDV